MGKQENQNKIGVFYEPNTVNQCFLTCAQNYA